MKRFLTAVLFLIVSLPIAQAATEQEVVNRSTKILRNFREMPETQIPNAILRNARGLAVMTVVKVGFGLSGQGGQGVLVARTRDGWSGPSFIGTGGVGWGLQIGAQISEFVFVLNTPEAVRAFSRDGNITLGADISASAGPVGRDVQANVTPVAAVYTYSRSKGLFAGISLEGKIIATQKTANARYYGGPVTAAQILTGRIPPAARAARLRAALRGY